MSYPKLLVIRLIVRDGCPMYCSKCGTSITLPDAIFCHKCGQRLVTTSDGGTVVGGNVTTGGGNFVGRDVLNKLSLLFSNSGGCISVTIIRVAIVLLCILLGTLLYQNPEVRTAVQRVLSEIRERLMGDANSPELLPAPSIIYVASVGVDQAACESGETDTITITVGTAVFYCYGFRNAKSIKLTRHKIIRQDSGFITDSKAGSADTFIVPDLHIAKIHDITTTTIISTIWIGYNPNDHPIITATDTTTVNVIPAGSQ